MDLIYMDDKKRDIGVMAKFSLDLAYGADENNFELSTDIGNNVCGAGYFIYVENTDYGGMIDGINVNTASKSLSYSGRTWHGILQSKIIVPDAGCDYLVVSGDANAILSDLIRRLDLSALFKVDDCLSGLLINSYKFNRYVNAYNGICKMLSTVNGKLKITFNAGYAILSAANSVDYSKDEEFDSSQIDFNVKKDFKAVNHMICLGRGDLAERTVIHLFVNAEGVISHEQSIFGTDEIVDTYDSSNAESSDELESGGVEKLKESWNSNAVNVTFNNTDGRIYDIGDVIGAHENVTGIYVRQVISKKIVTIKNNVVAISYKVGE